MDVSCIKAINRRLLPIQFEYDLSQEKRDLNFYRKWLTKENDELYLAIEGLKRLQERLKYHNGVRMQVINTLPT